jgi:putative heme iron utilization protein
MATMQEREFYEHARQILLHARVATLATAQNGEPFAALVTPAFLADLSPVLLLSEMSSHTRQLRLNGACALLVAGPATTENPQTAPRLCLSGVAAVAAGPELRAAYLAVHPYASLYVDFGDFAFWRMEVTAVQYVGGFAAAARLDWRILRETP